MKYSRLRPRVADSAQHGLWLAAIAGFMYYRELQDILIPSEKESCSPDPDFHPQGPISRSCALFYSHLLSFLHSSCSSSPVVAQLLRLYVLPLYVISNAVLSGRARFLADCD